MSENLWGDIPKAEGLRTPLFLLREQADVLTRQTEGVLIGAVKTMHGSGGGNLLHSLQIVAPALDQYSYTVLTVSHGVTIYPADVTDITRARGSIVEDEAALRDAIKEILSGPNLHKIIGLLLAQSRDSTA